MLRNATLADLARVLEEQKDAKRDVVVPASQITSEGGLLRVPGMNTILDVDGVTDVPGLLQPTEVCDGTVAEKLGIPVRYLRDVRAAGLTVPDYSPNRDLGVLDDGPLIDAMLNAHFAARDGNVMVRAFRGAETLPGIEGVGVGRAILSDRFATIDNIDVLYAALEAARDASASIEVTKVDLSERAMRVYFVAPEITTLAPILTRGYRSPFRPDGQASPVVQAGMVLDNSETGGSRFRLGPRFVMKACDNGITRVADAIAQTHLGGRLEAGLIAWSEETQRKNLDLIAAKTRDAVTTFLDVDYMTRCIAEIEERAGEPVVKPLETITVIAQRMKYTEVERETLLSHFIGGGQSTAGGILNAVTSMAQVVEDPDRAAEIEGGALEAMALVGTVR